MNINLRWLVAVIPAIVILPVLPAPLPLANSHGLREIAGYFQALALIRTGLTSYTYITPFESRSALHLHSLLSTPFLALGYQEAGRLVSLLAAIVGAGLLSKLATTTSGRRAGFLAPLFLWVQPIYARFAARWWPESLSIALTIAAVYTAYQYTQTTTRKYAIATYLLLLVAPTNHMWEASIVLPIISLFITTECYRQALLSGVVTAVAVAGTWVGTSFQPVGASSITHFGIHNDPSILLELSWWNGITRIPTHPTIVEETLILPFGMVIVIFTGYNAVTRGHPRDVLLATWTMSGLTIPLLLPFGADNHMYYVWGLVAPVAFFIAVESAQILPRLSRTANSETVARVVMSVLLVSALGSALVFETGIFEAAGGPEPLASAVDGDMHSQIDPFEYGELEHAGRELQRNKIRHPSQIAFVGNWGQNAEKSWTPQQRLRVLASYRVLVYSDVLVVSRVSDKPHRPTFVETQGAAPGCTQWVSHNGTTVATGACA